VGVRGSLADHFLNKCDLLFSIGSSLFPNRFSHAVPNPEKKTIIQCTVDISPARSWLAHDGCRVSSCVEVEVSTVH